MSGDSDSHRRQSVTVFCHIERVFGIYGGCEYVKDSLKTGKGCFTYEAGTTLEAISRDFQEDYPHDIILARVDGKLAELNSCMDRDAEIEFITTGEAVGNEVYRRTASMMMLKAFQDVVGRDNFERLTVQY